MLKSNLRVYWKESIATACEGCLNINNRDHEKGIYRGGKTIDEGGKMMKNRLRNIVSPLTPLSLPLSWYSANINERKLPKHAWMFRFYLFCLKFVYLAVSFEENRWRGKIIVFFHVRRRKKYCRYIKFITPHTRSDTAFNAAVVNVMWAIFDLTWNTTGHNYVPLLNKFLGYNPPRRVTR